MNQKTIAVKFVATLLTGLLMSGVVYAEGKAKSRESNSSPACHIENRQQDGYSPPKVIEFGDLKIKVVEEVFTPKHLAVFDLKAPGYIKRGVQLVEEQVFTDTICGLEVSVQMRSVDIFWLAHFRDA